MKFRGQFGSRSSQSRLFTSSRTRTFARGALAVAAVAALQGFCLPAASADTWDGGGGNGNWTTATNWADDTAPVSPEALIFAGNTQLATTNDFAVNTQFNGIEFAAGAGSFTLGGNAMILGGDINNNSGVAQTISFATTPFTFSGLTYQQGGLVLNGGTSNVNVAAGGSLSLGHITFGNAPKSTAVSTLNINNSASATGLAVQTSNVLASPNIINIATGRTFTVNGNVTIGTPQDVDIDPDVNIPTTLNFTGGGSLITGGGNFFVGLGSQNFDSGDRNVARVDMTALSNFTYSTGTTGTGLFGVGWMTRPDGQLRLSATSNTIVADVIGVGNSGITGTNSSPNNSGTTARLFLGAGTNVINADNINIGAVKGQGSIEWDAAVTTGTLTVAGQDGVARANITIANQSSAAGAGGGSFLSLAGHSVNVLAGTVQVGRLGGATGGTTAGTITFNTGTFDVNSLQVAANVSGSAANGVQGTFTMGGGSLTVNTAFILGNDTNATVTGPTNGTFNLNGGTVTANAPITRVVTGGVGGDTAVLIVAGGILNLTGKNIASATTPLTAVNISGGTLDNTAHINANAITITNTPTINGTPVYVLPAGGTLSSPGLTLGSGHGIEGGTQVTPATVTGDVTANSGGYLNPGSTGVAGTLTFNNNLTLNNNSTVNFDLGDTVGNNDVVNVTGNLTLSGTVNLATAAIGAGAAAGNTYTVMNYTGTLTGNETNFTTGAGGTRKTFTVVPTAGTPNQIQVSVGGSNPLSLVYIGDDNDNWEVQGAGTNWDATGTPEDFFNQDTVTFDDTSTNLNPVQVVGNVLPAAITVNATRNYTFAGSGVIGGATGLTKNGTGTLTVNTANTFTGGTALNAGIMVIGTGASLGTGDIVTNTNTFVRINRTDNSTMSNVISGVGNVEHTGTGTTTFTANKTYTGTTTISAGTVVIQDEGSFGGAGNGDVTIASGATLDITAGLAQDGIDFGAKTFNVGGTGVGGNGAIINNNGLRQFNAFERVNLTADTLVNTVGTGVTNGRFDFRRAVTDVDGVVDVALNNFTLTKTGGSQFSLVNLDVGPGNIVVNQGTFALEQSTQIPDNGGTITYNNGTTAQWFANVEAVDQNRPMIFNGSVSTGNASGTAAHIDANMTINGTLNHVSLNNQNTTQTTLAGNLTGPGALTKSGTTTLILAGTANTYAGGTTVNGGTLTVNNGNGLSSGPVAVNNTNTGAGNNVQVNLSTTGPTTIGSLSGTLSTPSSGANSATIDNGGQLLTVNQTAAGTYQGTIVGAGGLTKAGTATLTLRGINTYTGGTTVNAGTLEVKKMHAGNAVTINAGTLRVLHGAATGAHPESGDNAFVSQPSSLTIAAGATLDITNNDVILAYSGTSPAPALEALVASGFNGGGWDGTGITSITAPEGDYAVGIADNATLAQPYGVSNGGANFDGIDVPLESVLIKFTHRVDLNLDGLITPEDAATFSGFYSEGSSGATWATGDLDYDGFWTPNDAAIFGGFYNDSVQSLPEPASLAALGLLGLCLARRRRRVSVAV